MSKAVLQLLTLLAMATSCVPLEVLSRPTDYITFQSNVFTEGGYNVDRSIGNCISSREEVDGTSETVITCPQGELLIDGIKQTNLGLHLSSSEIRSFYTWRERLLPVKDAFITLRFLDGAIVPTRVEVYCLVLRDLRIRKPNNIRLYSSNTNSIYPETEIKGVDDTVSIMNSGRTVTSSSTGGDVTVSSYECQKYTLSIPKDEQTHLKYLRISLDFEGGNWMFVDEVEVYYDNESSLVNLTTTLPAPTFTFPTVNPYILHVTVIPPNLTINCTVTWEEDLTTTWSYNGVNISTSDKYTVTDSQLTIRGFTQEDIGVYQCTVQHPSGWHGDCEYLIDQGPNNSDQFSSSDRTLTLIVALAAGNITAVCICIMTMMCGLLCLRKKKNKQHIEYTNPLSTLAQVLENSYEHADTATHYVTSTETFEYGSPVKQSNLRSEEHLKSILLETKLEVTDYFLDTKTVTELDIYDDMVNTSPTLRKIQESVYCEDFDYSKQDTGDNDIYNCMYVPVYDNPTPLTNSEAPKLVEWNNVNVKRKIGEGQFGEIYLAKLNGIDVADLGLKNSTKILVAVKTLKEDYTTSLKQQFEKEIKFMARLDHDNVIRLLGICNKGMPFIMMEYMKNGDLHMFLRKHYHPVTGKDITTAEIQVDIPILLYIALQIANGMRYLASLGFIHRDLAARNCLVGEDYIVKVADFGMTQDLYNSAYFVMRGTALVPIRWMAPENFFGRFSMKTDVWSYGVTLWEIFTLCRQQPYEEMNDEELIFDVHKGPNRTLLKRPPIAPDELHNTMTRCWRHSSTQRPDFESVYKQLLEFHKTIH